MLYFTTGNPGADRHGGVRPGDNLISVSIVALDASTGASGHAGPAEPTRQQHRGTWAAILRRRLWMTGGLYGAIELLTNTIAWRRERREMCYSGSINTAGGLLFVGRSDGRLTALDDRNGDQLREFMTDAGVRCVVAAGIAGWQRIQGSSQWHWGQDKFFARPVIV